MADDGLKLELDEALSERLKAAAAQSGRPAEALAAELIAQGLDDDWGIAEARFAEYDRTGEYVDAEVAMKEFREALADRFKTKRG